MMRSCEQIPEFVWATARWLARHVPDLQDREDVEQELALAGWLAMSTHTEPAPLQWWVQMKMRYAMTDLGKARGRPVRWNDAGPDVPLLVEDDDAGLWPGVVEAGYGRVEDALVQAADRAVLGRVLAGVPREHAQRLVEHYLRGVSLRELGARRGVTEASEWGAMQRARRLARVEAERLGVTRT